MERITIFENQKDAGKKVIKQFNTKDLQSLQLESTSKGNQRKWFSASADVFVKEQFFYQGKYWKDNLVEVIASSIGAQMNLFGVEVLRQDVCQVVEGTKTTFGVFSPKFGAGKRFISYKRLLDMNGLFFDESASIESKWDSVLKNVKIVTGLEYSNYLLVMSLIDYLVGNEDRHLNNFGVLFSDDTSFSMAPLFDFGLGLFEHDRIYEDRPFRECVKKMQCKPFSANNQKLIDWLSKQYDLRKFFHGSLDLSRCEIPSPKAGSYLRNRCMALGIELKGVE